MYSMPGRSKRATTLAIFCLASSLIGCGGAQSTCPQPDPQQGIHKAGVFDDAVVAFEQSGNQNFPIDVVLYRASNGCQKNKFHEYEWAGGPPNVESVFTYTVRGKPNLFVIVSWEVDSPGAGVKGTLYDVYAYKKDGHGGLVLNDLIVKNKKIYSGIEGMANYEESHFLGKTPEGVKALVEKLGLK